uniref:Uncharacterized protein n=1 Tax=Panagrolaimus sp. JU765 TaxID=591449 RepID=A0AC34R4F1_9BILA
MKRLVVLFFCLQFCFGHPISADEPEPARQVVDDGKYYVISPSEDHVMLDALSLRKDTLSFYVGFKSGCHLEQFTEQLLGHFMLDGSNEVFLTYIFSSNKIRVKTKTLEAYQTLEEFGDKNIGGPASVAFKVTFDWHKN